MSARIWMFRVALAHHRREHLYTLRDCSVPVCRDRVRRLQNAAWMPIRSLL